MPKWFSSPFKNVTLILAHTLAKRLEWYSKYFMMANYQIVARSIEAIKRSSFCYCLALFWTLLSTLWLQKMDQFKTHRNFCISWNTTMKIFLNIISLSSSLCISLSLCHPPPLSLSLSLCLSLTRSHTHTHTLSLSNVKNRVLRITIVFFIL